MNTKSIPIHLELKEWLSDATYGIGAIGRKRIREDIIVHFESARAAALRDGASDDEAVRRAVASLGNADEARRHFKRTQLTNVDEVMLKKRLWSANRAVRKPWENALTFVLVLLMFALIDVFMPATNRAGMPYFLLLLLVLNAQTTDFLLSKFFTQRKFGVPILVGAFMGSLSAPSVFEGMMWWSGPFSPSIVVVPCVLMIAFFGTLYGKYFDMSRKLMGSLSEEELAILGPDAEWLNDLARRGTDK